MSAITDRISHWNSAFYTDPEKQVVFSPVVLVLSVLNRSHFDYWADFHTDSMMMFAYLKSVRRLVNLVIKAGMAGATASVFARAAACVGDVQLMTSCVQLVTPGRSSHDTGSTLVQHLDLKFEYGSSSANDNRMLQRERFYLFVCFFRKNGHSEGQKQSMLPNHSRAASVLKPKALE